MFSYFSFQAAKFGSMFIGAVVTLFAVCHYSAHIFLPIDYAVTSAFNEAWNANNVQTLVKGLGMKLVSKKITNKTELYRQIETTALKNGIRPVAGYAILRIESSDNKNRISPAGALGAMQIMPFNAQRCSELRPNLSEAELREELIDNDVFNIECWGIIYGDDLSATNNNEVLAAKRYNGGPKCLKKKCAESENYGVKFGKNIKELES